MKMLYFKHIDKINFKNTKGEDVEFNCNSLNLIERLYFSVFLTKLTLNSKKSLAEILFAYDKDAAFTGPNFKAYDNAITDIVEKKYIGLMHWMEDMCSADKKFKMYYQEIDTDDIYALRNGRGGYSIDSIAWKAFVLSAWNTPQKYRMNVLSKVLIINWLNAAFKEPGEFGQDEIKRYKANKTQTKRIISKWLDKVNISGEFKGDYFVVDANGCGNKGCSKPKEEIKKIEEAVKKAPNGTKVFEVIKNELPEENSYDYINEVRRWQKYYDETKEMNEEKWQSILKWIYANWGSVGDAITKIGKNHRVSKDVLDKAMRDEYLSDKEGGLVMKNALRKDLLELRQHILNSEFDDSWCEDPVIRKINVAFAYKCWPALMGME